MRLSCVREAWWLGAVDEGVGECCWGAGKRKAEAMAGISSRAARSGNRRLGWTKGVISLPGTGAVCGVWCVVWCVV